MTALRIARPVLTVRIAVALLRLCAVYRRCAGFRREQICVRVVIRTTGAGTRRATATVL
jgi:hypothetical protein